MTDSFRQKNSCWRQARGGACLPYVHGGIIILLGLICYANSLAVPQQFDDASVVSIADNINTDLFSWRGFFGTARWVVDVTFAVNRQLHGERVFGFHLVNLAIHLAAALAVYLMMRQTIAALQRTFRIAADDAGYGFTRRFMPFAVAVLFVCHPLQTQAVTYIVQRYASLTALFYLGSLLCYLLARLAPDGENGKRRWWWGVAAIVLALLAMKCKEIAFTLPLMMAALEVALFRGELLKKPLFLALGAVLLSIIPLQLLTVHGAGEPANLLGHMQVLVTETQKISRLDYLLTQFRVVATYLRLLFMPLNQNVDYDYRLSHTLFEPAVCAALLLHFALAGLAVALFIRSRRCFASATPAAGLAPRLASLGICWFYLALSVESSVIPIRDVIFEHRLYLPSVGFFMALAAGFAALAAYRPRYGRAAWVVVALLCGALTVSTIARNRIWSDEMAMWQDVMAKSPNKAKVRYYAGFLYYKKFMPDKAVPLLVRAVELDPGVKPYRIVLNAQIALLGQFRGRSSDGMQFHSAINTVNPRYVRQWEAVSYNNLGLAYEYLGNRALARESFLKAARINPSFDLARSNLALTAPP
jgi:hypothetical protein